MAKVVVAVSSQWKVNSKMSVGWKSADNINTKTRSICLLIVILIIFTMLSQSSIAISHEKGRKENSTFFPPILNRAKDAKWTFIVYLDADNNLEGAGIEDFNEMEDVGSTEDVNIVVLFDRAEGEDTSNGDWTDARIFYVQHDEDTTNMGNYEDNVTQWQIGEVNMGDPSVLANFTIWAMKSFPAEHYLLDLWDHGGAFWGVCWDDNDNDYLDMRNLSTALSYVVEKTGRKLDIIGFDACLMAQMAVLYEIYNYADYIVASGYTEPGDGWPYTRILSPLVENPNMSAEDLSRLIVDKYIESYTDRQSDPTDTPTVSMGAFNTKKLHKAFEMFNRFAMALAYGGGIHYMQNVYFGEIRLARSRTASYDMLHFGPFDLTGYCMYDVIDFITNLQTYAPHVYKYTSVYATQARSYIESAVVEAKSTPVHPRIHSLHMYFPNGLDNKYDKRFDRTKYAREMYWDDFLRHFINNTLAENTPPSLLISFPTNYAKINQSVGRIKISGIAFDIQDTLVGVYISVNGGSWIKCNGTNNWFFVLDTGKVRGNVTLLVRGYDGSLYSPPKTLHIFVLPNIITKEVKKGISPLILYCCALLIITILVLMWRKGTLKRIRLSTMGMIDKLRK
ncbi:MAG: hypothetical protein DRN20_04580 [Thermoplasmata archaeon]|nr:MAG: hypothetical protein DRN20_04580 [Thermoplasmata archaeon]